MCFRPERCTVIRLSGRLQQQQTSYSLQGHTIEKLDRGKYLGLTINKDLIWKNHINQTIGKASKTTCFLRRNLGRCTPATKATAHSTLVRPTLEYASRVWVPHHITTIRDIEQDIGQVQRRAARFVYSCYQDNSAVCVLSYWTNFNGNHCSADDHGLKRNRVLCYKTSQLIAIDPAKYYTSRDSRTMQR
ncbi:Hypothetical predicted protein [Mytilus galloprovincialis]|uniref:Uncharacterized protein n=1 Tax=Mytilus galloprovincialis TaxID=29158 RepID=A0A8B6EYZ8_MYTGA|nr:Hypothetical predicted protein [Mytilus galloprovincialis]